MCTPGLDKIGLDGVGGRAGPEDMGGYYLGDAGRAGCFFHDPMQGQDRQVAVPALGKEEGVVRVGPLQQEAEVLGDRWRQRDQPPARAEARGGDLVLPQTGDLCRPQSSPAEQPEQQSMVKAIRSREEAGDLLPGKKGRDTVERVENEVLKEDMLVEKPDGCNGQRSVLLGILFAEPGSSIRGQVQAELVPEAGAEGRVLEERGKSSVAVPLSPEFLEGRMSSRGRYRENCRERSPGSYCPRFIDPSLEHEGLGGSGRAQASQRSNHGDHVHTLVQDRWSRPYLNRTEGACRMGRETRREDIRINIPKQLHAGTNWCCWILSSE